MENKGWVIGSIIVTIIVLLLIFIRPYRIDKVSVNCIYDLHKFEEGWCVGLVAEIYETEPDPDNNDSNLIEECFIEWSGERCRGIDILIGYGTELS